MPPCIRCHKDMPEATPFCPFCGARQARTQHGIKVHGNGSGTVYKRGKTWTAKVIIGWKISEDGKRLPVSRTKGGFKTKAAASDACAQLLYASEAPKSTATFAQIFSQWEASYQGRISSSTMRCYQAAYVHFDSIQFRKFVDLRGNDLQSCIDACTAGKRTKQNMRTLLSLMYKYAMQNDIVDRNRASTLYTGDDPQKTRPAFSRDELEKIRQAVGVLPYADYVYCMCYLGYRPGEMFSLKKTDYDPAHNCFVGGSKTEAGRNRIVTISPKIMPIIQARLKAPGKYVFPRISDNAFMQHGYFREFCFAPLMASLGITDRVPYSCRHTFANLLKDVRGADTDKSALMGHADTSMTKEYQSADYASLQAITDKL